MRDLKRSKESSQCTFILFQPVFNHIQNYSAQRRQERTADMQQAPSNLEDDAFNVPDLAPFHANLETAHRLWLAVFPAIHIMWLYVYLLISGALQPLPELSGDWSDAAVEHLPDVKLHFCTYLMPFHAFLATSSRLCADWLSCLPITLVVPESETEGESGAKTLTLPSFECLHLFWTWIEAEMYKLCCHCYDLTSHSVQICFGSSERGFWTW